MTTRRRGQAVPLPDETTRRARTLRRLLREGALAGSGYVALEGGPTLSLESAVEITLLGLDDLVRDDADTRIVLAREWHDIGSDIELLYRTALMEPDARPIWPEWRPSRGRGVSRRA